MEKVPITTRVEPELVTRLERFAEEIDSTKSATAREALNVGFEELKRRHEEGVEVEANVNYGEVLSKHPLRSVAIGSFAFAGLGLLALAFILLAFGVLQIVTGSSVNAILWALTAGFVLLGAGSIVGAAVFWVRTREQLEEKLEEEAKEQAEITSTAVQVETV